MTIPVILQGDHRLEDSWKTKVVIIIGGKVWIQKLLPGVWQMGSLPHTICGSVSDHCLLCKRSLFSIGGTAATTPKRPWYSICNFAEVLSRI